MVQEKFIFSSIRLKEVAGKYRLLNEAVGALFVQLFLYIVVDILHVYQKRLKEIGSACQPWH